jgi:hypothetical protein
MWVPRVVHVVSTASRISVGYLQLQRRGDQWLLREWGRRKLWACETETDVCCLCCGSQG